MRIASDNELVHCIISIYTAQMDHTPLDLARQHGHETVVVVLESEAMKEVQVMMGSLCLHTCYMCCYTGILQLYMYCMLYNTCILLT